MGLAACGSAQAAQESDSSTGVRTIRAVTGGSPAPYTYKDESGTLTGENIELTKAIFKELPQYKLEFETADFKAIFPGLDSGRYQIGVNNFAKTDERKDKYLFSKPIYKNRYVAVVAPGSSITKVDSLSDLAGHTMLTSADGTNISIALQKYNKSNPDDQINLKFSSVDIPDEIRQVENGQVDAIIIDGPMFDFYTKKLNSKTQAIELGEKVSQELQDQNYSYLVFPKGEEKLRDEVNEVLTRFDKDGTTKKLTEKWFGSDQTPSPDAR
nr:transporter substrate-binding domain-containing protein [Bifidobacterium santillanense]